MDEVKFTTVLSHMVGRSRKGRGHRQIKQNRMVSCTVQNFLTRLSLRLRDSKDSIVWLVWYVCVFIFYGCVFVTVPRKPACSLD